MFDTWQFNILAYLISNITFYQCYKLAVRNVKRDGAATILLQTIAGITVLLLAPFFFFSFPTNPLVYGLFFLSCIFYAINDRLQTTSRKHLPVSVYSILNQLSTVFLIIMGVTIFREGFVWQKIIGAGLILLANLFLFYEKGTFRLNKYVWVGTLATFFFALAISTDIGISKQFNLPFYIMITFFLPALIIFFGERIKTSEVVQEYKGKDKKWFLITGVAWAGSVFFYLRAISFGSVTTLVSLGATAVLLNVIVAFLFLGERSNKAKKIIAAIIVILGVYLTISV